MTIQIVQTFPHCARCGKMMHMSQKRIVAQGNDGADHQFCSMLCRDEYDTLHGLANAGTWQVPTTATRR